MDAHRFSVRANSRESGGARVYVRRRHFDIGAPLSFDVEYPCITALESLLGAVAGDLISGMTDLARKRRLHVVQVEALVQAELQNPLVSLGVVGEEGHPGIDSLQVKIYADTPESEESMHELWEEVKRRSPLWHTFRSLVRFDVQLIIT